MDGTQETVAAPACLIQSLFEQRADRPLSLLHSSDRRVTRPPRRAARDDA
jgi:hypothetical protein